MNINLRKILRLVKLKANLNSSLINPIIFFNQRPTLYKGCSPTAIQVAIEELQPILKSKGLLTNLTGKFDTDTEDAVKRFQSQNKLQTDGIVGALTWACLLYPQLFYQCDKTNPELQKSIQQAQEILVEEGFLSQEDFDQRKGVFDRKMQRSVRQFQRNYGLKPDGVVGANTWLALLGIRQSSDFIPFHFFFILEQLLMIALISLGIYYSPLPGSTDFELGIVLTTAYGLSALVPYFLDHFSFNNYAKQNRIILQYSPYVLIGMLWKPMLSFLEQLIK